MNTEQTVFIVEDEAGPRESLEVLIKANGWKTRCFASAEDFIDQTSPEEHGCLVTDLKLGRMSGLELQGEMVRHGYAMPVIIITGFGSVDTAVSAMQQGALTMLEKPCPPETLVSNVRKALERDKQSREHESTAAPTRALLEELSKDEREVLDRLIAGKKNRDIAEELDSGLRTVELRRSQIMRKLHATSFAELVRIVTRAQLDSQT